MKKQQERTISHPIKECKRSQRKIFEMSHEQIISDLNRYGMLHRIEFQSLIQSSISVLKFEPNLIHIESPVIVVGDIHGQFFDLLNIFQKNGYPPNKKYVFLGDYVDRGDYSIEVITLLFWLKLKYPKHVVLLRGNHQSKILTSKHNFRSECKDKYNGKIYELVIFLFEVLPICCIIDRKYFCVHAGISPSLQTICNKCKQSEQIQKINRCSQIPVEGILCDLLWSDPTEEDRKDWPYNTTRSCSFFYTKSNTQIFLKNNKLRSIIRGHQVQLKGYRCQQISKKDKQGVITIFSAPNYCKKYNNLGAVAIVTQQSIKMSTFKYIQDPINLPKFDLMQWSLKSMFSNIGKIFVSVMKNRITHEKNINDPSSQKNIKQMTDELQKMKNLFQTKQNDEVMSYSEEMSHKIKEKQNKVNQLPYNNILNILYFMVNSRSDQQEEAMPRQFPKIEDDDEEEEESYQNDFKSIRNTRTEQQLLHEKDKNSIFKSERKVNQNEQPIIFGPKIKFFKKVDFHRKNENQQP